MELKSRIKELRCERELSQRALAKAIGVSPKAINFWELGVNEPKASYKIFRGFNRLFTWLNR